MIEIEYIPLKTPDGQTAGHARVQGGFVDVRLRRNDGGQALVLTDGGYVSGSPETRIRAGGQVTAVAIHTAGSLACVGFARIGAPTLADIRRRIDALAAKPAPAKTVPHESANSAPLPAEAPTPVPAEASTRAAHDAGEETEVVPMRRSARHVPADNDVKRALDRLAQPGDAAFFPPDTSEKTSAPRVLPAFSDDADDARAAAFAELLARADAVFRRISDPFEEEEMTPLPFRAHAEPATPEPVAPPERAPEPAPASRDLDAWSRAVDDILSDAPAPTARSIENPFPHIFPDARFVHRGDLYGGETLTGEWERGGEPFSITAVRGDYSPQPPEALAGFTRYIRTLRGGFWVRVEDGSASLATDP